MNTPFNKWQAQCFVLSKSEILYKFNSLKTKGKSTTTPVLGLPLSDGGNRDTPKV